MPEAGSVEPVGPESDRPASDGLGSDPADSEPVAGCAIPLLRQVGVNVKSLRKLKGWSRRQLAECSGVSQRFIALLERDAGNISVVRLNDIAAALDVPLVSLFGHDDSWRRQVQLRALTATDAELVAIDNLLGQETERVHGTQQRYALIGLRGAGKSTLGMVLAQHLGSPLLELDAEIEQGCGMGLSEIFSLYGHAGFTRLQRETLERLVQTDHNADARALVITTAGGIVTDPVTFGFLQSRFITVWVHATAEEHLQRVLAQGDARPMRFSQQPLAAIELLLQQRTALYSQATLAVDTSGLDIAQASELLINTIALHHAEQPGPT